VLEIVRAAAVQALASEQDDRFQTANDPGSPSASIADAQAWNEAEVAYWKNVTDGVKIELPE
jgi:hypothetical protein